MSVCMRGVGDSIRMCLTVCLSIYVCVCVCVSGGVFPICVSGMYKGPIGMGITCHGASANGFGGVT
jgi:hypothetical protein